MSNEKKLALTIICGGESTEHSISVHSARNVVAMLNPARYEIAVIYIDPQGLWHWLDDLATFVDQGPQPLLKQLKSDPVIAVFGNPPYIWQSRASITQYYRSDCVFPLVHGTHGEDGALQGLLDLLHVPYVGADVQSSALCIEKDVMKRLLHEAKIPTSDWYTLYPSTSVEGLYPYLCHRFDQSDLFIKPVSLGSSVGVSPASDEAEFREAVDYALCFDDRLLIEPKICGREIECSVLGNHHPKASLAGEILPHADYYSYDAKYVSDGVRFIIPAEVSATMMISLQEMAIATFQALHCSGMARVDFFVEGDEKIWVNEINTIPGFTSKSLYPTLWEASGLMCRDLLDQLITLALDRYREQTRCIRSYPPAPL